MKKILIIASLFSAMCCVALFNSCGPDSSDDNILAAPTSLKAEGVTDVSAVLSWNGGAPSYELIVSEGETERKKVTVTEKSYTVDGLAPATKYMWKVRAIDEANGLTSAWADGVPFTTEAVGAGPEPPTNLAWSDVTASSASFTWIGVTSCYEIEIAGKDIVTVHNNMYTAAGLDAETTYQWKVRAVDMATDLRSAWVSGKEFTTGDSVAPEAYIDGHSHYKGTANNDGMYIALCTAEMDNWSWSLADGFASGIVFEFALFSNFVFDEPIDERAPSIPDGTYSFSASGDNRVSGGSLIYIVNGHNSGSIAVESGTVTIERTGEIVYPSVSDSPFAGYPYIASCNLLLEDGSSYKITFDGIIDVDNRIINTSLWDDFDFGIGDFAEVKIWGEETPGAYLWVFEAMGGDGWEYYDGIGYFGYGPRMQLEFYTATTVGHETIPLGEYIISNSQQPGTVMPGGWGQEYSYYHEIPEMGDSVQNYAPFDSGKIVISKTGDKYRIELKGVQDDVGFNIEGYYEGPVTIIDYTYY